MDRGENRPAHSDETEEEGGGGEFFSAKTHKLNYSCRLFFGFFF
jgi:hypothetical protein